MNCDFGFWTEVISSTDDIWSMPSYLMIVPTISAMHTEQLHWGSQRPIEIWGLILACSVLASPWFPELQAEYETGGEGPVLKLYLQQAKFID